MQVVTNQGFVKTHGRLGRISSLLGFAVLIGGLFLSWQQNELVIVAYLSLIPGYLLIMYGNYNTLRWGMKPRVDEILGSTLKALDHKHQLFNYSRDLPADNVLLTPNGVVVLEVRPNVGEFSVSKGKWHRHRGLLGWVLILGEGALGNPTRDAERNAAAVKQLLSDRLGEKVAEQVPVESIVVFTHPRAKLEVDDSDVSAALATELRTVLRRLPVRGKMPGEVYRQVARVLRSDPEGLTRRSA